MDGEGSPSLEIGFIIDPQYAGLAQLQQAMDSTEAKVLQEAKAIERATGNMVNLGGATAQISSFGSAATRELESVRQATAKAEKAGEGMVRQLQRQAETFGKTTTEIRNMRAEQRALAAEGQGLTELADRIRAANAEMVRLEKGTGGAARGSSQMRAAMQGASFQVQDFITQVSMGTNPINALAVQGGQLAGQFANVGGKAGAVASFLLGPWGLAITAGTMILAPFIGKLLDGNNALDDAVDKLKKDAKETEVASRAKEAFGRTLDGVTIAAQENEKALDALRNAGRTQAQQAADATRVQVLRIEQIRAETVAEIELARAMVEGNRIRMSRGGAQQQDMAAGTYLRESGKLDALEGTLAKIDVQLAAAQRRSVEALSFAAVERGKLLSTSAGRINKQYDDLLAATRARLVGENAATAEIMRQTVAIERQREVALNAESEKTKAVRERISLETRAAAAATATATSVAAQLRRELPGVQVTSTTGGKHVKGSDHYANRAIDFVPAGGMGSMSKDDVRSLFAKMGLPVRRNAAGVEQLFGPGDKGHSDHWHVAWTKGKEALDNYRASLALLKPEQAEAKREAQQILDQAQGFLAGLADETGRIGKTATEIKMIEVAAAAARAPTQELRDAILAVGYSWEEATKANASTFLSDKVGTIDLDKALLPVDLFRSDAEVLQQHLTAIADQAALTGDALAEAFGRPGAAMATLLSGLSEYRLEREKISAAVADKTMDEAKAAQSLAALNARNTTQALAGVKSLFKERSTAFKIMSGVEKAYAAFQAAQTIAAIARDIAHTGSSVANSTTRAAADQAAGASKIFSQLGVYAFPVVAGMIALLASLGMKGGGKGGAAPPTSAEDLQASAGTGTVLGNGKAQSESIARSLELVAKNTSDDLQFNNPMLRALHSIDDGIARMTGSVARQIQVSGSMFDTSRLNLGQSGKSGFLGLFGSSTTKSLYDLGMQLNAASVGSILAGGISGSTYQTIEKIKKKSGFLGIGGGTKTSYSTTTGAIDPSITAAVQDVVASLRNGLLSGASVIGLDGAQALLDGFRVNIGKLSFKDMSGEEIERQLNAVFSNVGDRMAAGLLPALGSMQLVGEGLFETFMRVAKQYESVDMALRSIGRTFGMVGVNSVAARDALVQLFGGLDEFLEGTNNFRDQFLTEAEQIAPVAAAVREEMARLGVAGITTRDQFKQAVLGLDLTSAAGRGMYASLLKVAPAFDKVLDYQEKAQGEADKTLQSTVETFKRLTEGLTKYRDTLFATDAAQADAYASLKAKFSETAALAAQGNETALGGLEGAGKAFLEAAMNNASTREQYQRDVALVAQGVDKGIFAAKETADYAQLQLDALKNANAVLAAIDANTAATAAALAGMNTGPVQSLPSNETVVQAAATSAPPPPTVPDRELGSIFDRLVRQIAEMRSENTAGLAAVAGNTGQIARRLDDVTSESGGNAFAMVTTA